jgi:DNA repair protein RadD
MFELRYYQAEAVKAVHDYLSTQGGNPCVVLPTGAGKTVVIAQLCHDVVRWGGRVCVMAHVKELLEQSEKTLRAMLPGDDVGVYSAGLNSRDTDHKIICAGIQSVAERAGELGRFNLIIIDEAHLISPNEGTRYQTFLRLAKMVNPKVRILGLTATPYRLDAGMVCAPDHILNDICYEVGVRELIAAGYLAPIRTKCGREVADLNGVHRRGGEFIESEMAAAMDAITEAACVEFIRLTEDRSSVLVFSSSLDHAGHIVELLKSSTAHRVELITGNTPSDERAAYIADFKAKKIKYLVNVNVLTTGFDAPNVDAVVLLRATLSPGLYCQMVGRGLRKAEGKADCIVLDYGNNIIRHGAIDAIEIKSKTIGEGGGGEAKQKVCPQCMEAVFVAVSVCPACGYEFPREARHDMRASSAGILSGEVVDTWYDVIDVDYRIHESRKNPGSLTMRVDYYYSELLKPKSEWVCIEHEGFAREKASAWWRERAQPVKRNDIGFPIYDVPKSVEEAVYIAKRGDLKEPLKILWREVSGKPYGEIAGYEWERVFTEAEIEEVPW